LAYSATYLRRSLTAWRALRIESSLRKVKMLLTGVYLKLRDPKTNALLWAFTEHVQLAVLKETRDDNFDQTMAKLISDLQGLSAPSNNAQKP
jgi:hypothetical protein